MSNSLWNLHVVAHPEADSDFDTVTEWAAGEIETLRAKVAELQEWNAAMVEKAASGGVLDGYRELGQRCADAEKRAEAAEAQLTALPKWAQSSESKGQFYRKSIQEMAALRGQLTALREGLDTLIEIWEENEKKSRSDEDCFIGAQCAEHVKMLLKKTAPTVNSADRN